MTTTPEHEHREPIDISDLAARASIFPNSENVEGPRTSGPRQWRETGEAWTLEAADEFDAIMSRLLDGTEVDA